MSNEQRASANEHLRPVSDLENSKANRMALTCDAVHESDLEKISAVRKQQADYLDSLPDNAKDACGAVCDVFVGWDEGQVPTSVAKGNFLIIKEVMRHCEVDDHPDLQEALALLAESGLEVVREIERGVKLASDIAGRGFEQNRML
ncbi:hypothetical protein [Pseudoruegeria sp. SK021]|uniref:hypothetical protein n=1 Tax=Pseudoruegeria sp. SK021 TaxID=1933035 RepID=UPI000A234C70|nr:hypothetical protein [Pseudoruegeria sp. SK021]OSP53827.1 hypothetical protein BV911_15795 [Pseudoruegeria sp. SK021]